MHQQAVQISVVIALGRVTTVARPEFSNTRDFDKKVRLAAFVNLEPLRLPDSHRWHSSIANFFAVIT